MFPIFTTNYSFEFQVMKTNFDRDFNNACAMNNNWLMRYGRAVMHQAFDLVMYAEDKIKSKIKTFEAPLKRTMDSVIVLQVGHGIQITQSAIADYAADFAKGFKLGFHRYVLHTSDR